MMTANPVAGAQTMMSVVCPPGAAPGSTIQVNVNGAMMSVQVPPGVAPGAMFQISAPAAPVLAVATPVGAPVVPAQQQEGDMAQPANAGFAEKAVVEAKIVRRIEPDRQYTDVAWAGLFLLTLVIQWGLGFYEFGNALSVVAGKWDTLDQKQAEGECPLWLEGQTVRTESGGSGRLVNAIDGPSTTGAAAVPADLASVGVCGAGELAAWVTGADGLTCSPPAGEGWDLGEDGTTPVYGACPPPPPSPYAAIGGEDLACAEAPPAEGGDTDSTDSTDCAGSGRRQLQYSRSRSRRRPSPPPPPTIINYAVANPTPGPNSSYISFELRNPGDDSKFERFAWLTAKAQCEAKDARLCTSTELRAGQGGGCGTLSTKYWAADACDGGHVAVEMWGGGIAECVAEQCGQSRGLRCCADTQAGKDAATAAAASAPVQPAPVAITRAAAHEDDDGSEFTSSGFVSGLAAALFACLLVSTLSGIGFIVWLRTHPRCATWFANLFFPAILLLVAIFCMFVGQAMMSLVLLIVAALSVCMILCWRAQLELAAQLLALGSNTLLENGGLIPVKIICMIMEVIFTIPILIFIVASNVQDGDWAGSTSGGECQSVCAWSTSGSASTYYHFFMLIWVGFLFMEIIVHTIAGTTAIWYFHRNDDSYDYPSSPAFTALKWSLSSAFGSLAMASFILTVVRIIVMMVRAMEENMREEGGAAAFLACILRCIIETIEAWIQFITKMSTITVAITNDEFWSSCKRTMGMFYRCYLEGIMVERFAKITMSFLAAAVSLIMFVLSYTIMNAVLPDEMTGEGTLIPILPALLIGIIAYFTLQLLAGGVLVIINSLYMSYLIDLDNAYEPNEQTVAIHELYKRAVDDSIGFMNQGKGSYKKSGPYRKQFEMQQSAAR